MKAIAAVTTLLAILTLAGPVFGTIYVNDFDCTRQTWVGRGTYTSNANYSARTFGRVCKGEFDIGLMDFNRSAMQSWVQGLYTAANAGTLTNVNQIGNGAVTMTLYATAYDSWEDSATPPPTIFGHMFWPGVRLSKGQNWVESTATFNYADASTNAQWHDMTGAPIANIFVTKYDMTSNMVLNATSATWGQADTIGGGSDVYVYDTPRPWVLDNTVAWAAMTNPDAVGFSFVLDMYNKPWGTPSDSYSDDSVGTMYGYKHGLTEYRPYVEVDVDSSKIVGGGGHTYPRGDFNHDMKVDQTDLQMLLDAINSGLGMGDFNEDGKISFADYLILEQNFGKTVASQQLGDANGDGNVTFADYLILERNFGHTHTIDLMYDLNGDGKVGFGDYLLEESLVDGTPTPEPATIGLLVAGGLAILRRRRQPA